jgi:hypothetical protein
MFSFDKIDFEDFQLLLIEREDVFRVAFTCNII